MLVVIDHSSRRMLLAVDQHSLRVVRNVSSYHLAATLLCLDRVGLATLLFCMLGSFGA